MLHCAALAGILGVVALIVEQMPGWNSSTSTMTIVKARFHCRSGDELKTAFGFVGLLAH